MEHYSFTISPSVKPLSTLKNGSGKHRILGNHKSLSPSLVTNVTSPTSGRLQQRKPRNLQVSRTYIRVEIVVNVNFAVANKLLLIETSALDATNIDAAFEELLGNIYNIVASKNLSPTAEKSNVKPSARTSLILPSEPPKKDSTGCC